jgi:Fe-S-cluster containining protein
MGSCHMCGMCCEAIHIQQSPEEVANLAEPQIARGVTDMDSDPVFVHLNWVPITREEAHKINPFLAVNERTVRDTWSGEGATSYEKLHFYTCKHHDKVTRKCTIHEIRPRVCSEYPWYGRNPEPSHLFYSEDCGYREDLLPKDGRAEV